MTPRPETRTGLGVVTRPEVQELLEKLNALIRPEGCTVAIQLTPRPATALQPLYSVSQVADMIGKSPSTVRAWCNDGELPARKMGGAWYISRAALEAIGLK